VRERSTEDHMHCLFCLFCFVCLPNKKTMSLSLNAVLIETETGASTCRTCTDDTGNSSGNSMFYHESWAFDRERKRKEPNTHNKQIEI